MKKISLILISLLFINFHLYNKQLYIWADMIENKLYCFDRQTETLNQKSLINIQKDNRPSHARKIGGVVYVSNFIVTDYLYHSQGQRGGLSLWDIRDNSYREIEATDLVNNYFSSTTPFRDDSGMYLIFMLINTEDYGVGTDRHETDYFKWNPNESSTPTQISSEEYLSLISTTSYCDWLDSISSKSGIETKYTNGDYVFFYNGKMEVWSHEEDRYYTLRSIPDFESKNASVFLNNGYPEDQIRDKHRKYRRMHFISVDGMRSVKMAR